ncbi:MAG: hypothetical protein JXR64_03935 [Spirochaetales bacterium]|nr:hypothetical protein [Spirochaetales bacterium]
MIRKIASIIFILAIISCSKINYSELIIVDDYFSIIHNIKDESKNSSIYITSINEFDFGYVSQYTKIAISPLLYVYYKTEIDGQFNQSQVTVFDNTLDDKVNITYKPAIDLLFSEIQRNSDFKNITVFIEEKNSQIIEEVDILKKIDNNKSVSFYYILNSTNRTALKEFVQDKNDTDLWVIISDSLGSYIYSLIKTGQIVIENGSYYHEINENVRYSIAEDFGEVFEDVFKERTLDIKKYLRAF